MGGRSYCLTLTLPDGQPVACRSGVAYTWAVAALLHTGEDDDTMSWAWQSMHRTRVLAERMQARLRRMGLAPDRLALVPVTATVATTAGDQT